LDRYSVDLRHPQRVGHSFGLIRRAAQTIANLQDQAAQTL
jgi:hypothetical protein